MRRKIILSLMKSPANANQLAERLGVNYRTVMHHLQILEENGLIKSEGPKYGKMFFVTELFSANYELFNNIVTGSLMRGRRKW